jgi:hypothetical protein
MQTAKQLYLLFQFQWMVRLRTVTVLLTSTAYYSLTLLSTFGAGADAVQCSRSGLTKLVQALVAARGIRPHWLLFVVRAHDGVVVGTVHGVQIRVGVAMRHWSVTKTGESNRICWILAYNYHFRRAGANGCLVRRVPCDDGPYRCITY